MTCLICKVGEATPGQVTVTLQRGVSTIIIREAPADVCGNCGEYYLSDEVMRQVLARAESAVKRGEEVEVQRYAA